MLSDAEKILDILINKAEIKATVEILGISFNVYNKPKQYTWNPLTQEEYNLIQDYFRNNQQKF